MAKKLKLTVSLGLLAFLFWLVFNPVASSAAPPKKVNINTASVAELQTLPRIGPQIAQRIVDYRTKNGKFKRVEDIMKVRGIGEKVFEEIKDKITIGSNSSQ